MEQHDCDEFWARFEIQAEQSQNCHCFHKTLSQQKHVVHQSMAVFQLKRFKVGRKVAIAASAPVLPNQKKTVLQNRPIHWCTYINDHSHMIQKKNNKENIEGLQDVSVLQFVYYWKVMAKVVTVTL